MNHSPVTENYPGRRRPLMLIARENHERIDRRASAVWDTCPLTHRQLEVLQLCAEGLTYEEVANDLGIGTKGVHKLLQEARAKVGLGRMNRTLLVAVAMREGWIH